MGKLTAYKQSRVDQRNFILTEFKKGCESGPELHQKLRKRFKNDPAVTLVSQKSIYLWLTRFKMGQFDVDDRPRSGRPVIAEEKPVLEAIEKDPYVSVADLCCDLDLPRNSTKACLARCGLMNVNIVWVPREMTPELRQTRINHCLQMLQRQESDPFLDRVVFEGEKYITYNKYKQYFKKKDAKNVLRPNEATIAQSGLRPHKIVMHLWWTHRGLVMYKLVPESSRTKEKYLEELTELQMKLVQEEERTEFFRDEEKPWILYHNRDTYLSEEVNEKIANEFGWEQIIHPKNCPDLSPTDFHIFQKFQFAFNTTLFTRLEEVEQHVFKYWDSRRSKFFKEPITILPEKWHRIIETEGDYIATNEKL